MTYSNRTSFMTAEQDSPRTSQKASVERNPSTNYHRNDMQFYGTSGHRKSTSHSHQKSMRENSFENVHLSPSTSSKSSISEGIESSHTIINGSSQTIYSLPDVNRNHSINKAEIGPNSTINSTSQQSTAATTAPELKTYPIAWVLLFFIVVIRAAVAIFSNTFSPIPSVTADFLGISLSSINWLYNTMAICYIVASFFTSYLYQKIGVKWSVSLLVRWFNGI